MFRSPADLERRRASMCVFVSKETSTVFETSTAKRSVETPRGVGEANFHSEPARLTRLDAL